MSRRWTHPSVVRLAGGEEAEYENAQRAERTSKDRLAKAMSAQVLVAFTAGVVWADKDDPEFRKGMVDVGWRDTSSPNPSTRDALIALATATCCARFRIRIAMSGRR